GIGCAINAGKLSRAQYKLKLGAQASTGVASAAAALGWSGLRVASILLALSDADFSNRRLSD
ncbi:MAG TPA: hypothetical protein VE969_11665, partial [Pyrinomonadaceae bacterium]|nr:hypothetical protein [Pyrinomonadaceae bacterium]